MKKTKRMFWMYIIVYSLSYFNYQAQEIKFSSEKDLSGTGEIQTISSSDFNNDGKIDLVTAGYDFVHHTVNLQVSLNNTPIENSEPLFSNPVSLQGIDYSPKYVQTGDINSDGKNDVIVSDIDSSVYIYLNSTTDGDTVLIFNDKVEFNTGRTIINLKLSDINNDGKIDIVTTNYDSKSISILLNSTIDNSSTPQFLARQDIILSSNPQALSVDDYNLDGKKDIAITDVNKNLSIFTNNSELGSSLISFSESSNIFIGDFVYSISAADLTGDLFPEIILPKKNVDSLYVFVNNSRLGDLTPSFSNANNFYVGHNPLHTEINDFNQDGKLDVLVARSDRSFSILLNNSIYGENMINFSSIKEIGISKAQIFSSIADYNNDGRNDIALLKESSNQIGIFLNETNLNFKRINDSQSGFGPVSMDYADFNNDNKMDLVTGSFGDFSVLLGTGDGHFQNHFEVQLNKFSPNLSIVAADFNNDNNDDVAITNGNGNDYVSIFLGNGMGSFSSENSFNTENSPMGLSVGDFNNDSFLDLVTANSNVNSISVLIGNGDGTFLAAVNYPTNKAPVYTNVNDFNMDGNPDIAVVNQNSNSVSLYLGNGDGTFGNGSDLSVGNTPVMLTSEDFNNDSNNDLVAVNSFESSISILLGNGDGTFSTKVDYSTGISPLTADVGDFNLDGFIDIAVTNQNNSVSILYNQGNGIFSPSIDYKVGSGPFQIVCVDLNNDSAIDIATSNSASDSVSVLLNQIPILTSVDIENKNIIENFSLKQNFPNPFNPTTNIEYSIKSNNFNYPQKVNLKIYNLLGQELITLIDEEQTAGTYHVKIHSGDLASGVYIYSLHIGHFTKSKKMILLK